MTSNTLVNKEVHRFRWAFLEELRRGLPFLVGFSVLCILGLIVPGVLELAGRDSFGAIQGGMTGQMSRELLREMSRELYENHSLTTDTILFWPQNYYTFSLNPLSAWGFPLMAYLLGLLQFSYLTNRRAMDVFASLPIKRGTALRAKLVSGLCMLCVPTTLCYLILFAINIAVRGFLPVLLGELLWVLLVANLFLLVAYLITVCLATLTGTITEQVLYPPLVIGMPALICVAAWELCQQELYGIVMPDLAPIAMILCPFVIPAIEEDLLQGISNRLLSLFYEKGEGSFWSIIQPHVFPILLWVFLCGVLVWLTHLGFRHRKTETAGMRDKCRPLTLAAGYLGITCAGMVVCILAHSIGGIWNTMRYPLMILVTAAGFFIFQLVIRHSVSEALHSFKGYLPAAACYLVLIAVMVTEGFGILLKLPDENQIERVTTNYRGISGLYDWRDDNPEFSSEDPDVIAQLLKANSIIVKQEENENPVYENLYIKYDLKNGKSVQRAYKEINTDVKRELLNLDTRADFRKENHFAFQDDFSKYYGVQIVDLYQTRFSNVSNQLDLEKLQQALQKDVLEESTEDWQTGKPPVGIIQLLDGRDTLAGQLTIYVQGYYESTIAYLEQNGLLEYMQPDYTRIPEVKLITFSNDTMHQVFGGYAGDILGFFYQENIEDLHVMTGYEGDQYWETENVEVIRDPEEVKRILKHCYTKHFYDSNAQGVLVPIADSSVAIGDSDTVQAQWDANLFYYQP